MTARCVIVNGSLATDTLALNANFARVTLVISNQSSVAPCYYNVSGPTSAGTGPGGSDYFTLATIPPAVPIVYGGVGNSAAPNSPATVMIAPSTTVLVTPCPTAPVIIRGSYVVVTEA
jgi:hypothetical protein